MCKARNRMRLAFKSIIPLLAIGLISASCNTIKSSSKTVQVGYLPIYVDMPLFVAKEHGFFLNRGLDVTLTRFESSPDMGTALLNNSLDAAASISTSVALSTESRDPGKMRIFLVDAENKDNYLSSFVTLKTSGINALQQLKGKTIGSFPGPGAAVFGKLVLEKAGLNPQVDVKWVEIAAQNQLSALETHTVDALFAYEPTGTQAVLEKNAQKIAPGAVESNVIDPWQAGVWAMSKNLVVNRPEIARQFVLAIYDAVDYMRRNPQEAKAALSKYTSISTSVAQATPNIPFTKLSEVDIPALQRQADILTDKKLLSKTVSVRELLLPADYVPHQ